MGDCLQSRPESRHVSSVTPNFKGDWEMWSSSVLRTNRRNGFGKQITVLCRKGWGLAPRKDCPALWGAQHLSPKADVPQEPLSLNVLWLYPALCLIHNKGSVKYKYIYTVIYTVYKYSYPVSETEMLIPLGHLAQSSGSTACVLVPPLCPLWPCTPSSSGGPWIWAHGVWACRAILFLVWRCGVGLAVFSED